MLPGRPGGDLGPRYTVDVQGADRRTRPPPTITQDLYPYADGGPVAYMRPGQPVFGSSTTAGGWFRAPDRSSRCSSTTACRATAPGGDGGTDVLGPLAAFTAILLAGALFVLALTRVRRRPKPSPA